MKRAILGVVAAMILLPLNARAAEYEIVNRPGIVFAKRDGIELAGDFYLPKGMAKAPVLVAIHGGGWRGGNRNYYRYWSLFLARAGYAVFAIDYRLGKDGRYPAPICDAKTAVQFVRVHASDFNVDPDRIGVIGDSAGAYLAAMLALAGDRFDADGAQSKAATSIGIKVMVGFYGVYDLLAQWKHDEAVMPHDSIVQDFLGASPSQQPQVYLDASPIHYAEGRSNVGFLLIHGDRDHLVDLVSQSGAFAKALTEAGSQASVMMVEGAGHSWAREPFEDNPHSFSARIVPRLMKFLKSSL